MGIPTKFSVSAPGKIILHGEHSVVYGHQAVAASLNLRSRVDFELSKKSLTDEGELCLSLPDVDLKLPLSIKIVTDQLLSLTDDGVWDIMHPEQVEFGKLCDKVQKFMESDLSLGNLAPRQHQALTCCLFLMSAIFHKPNQAKCVLLEPFSLKFSSELPIGAGAGSSASFCVCFATAFIAIASFYIEPQQTFTLDDKRKELISRWAFLGERIMHGKPSGLDNCICTFGSAIAFKRPNDIFRIPLTHSIRVLLVDTKVGRETRVLVENVAKLKDRHENVLEHIMQAMDNISKEAINLFNKMKMVADCMEKQMEYFSRMKELWSINHALLAAIGVSHPSLERIIQVAQDFELCGKLTGAGGGGFAIILLPPQSILHHKLSDESVLLSLKGALEKEGFAVKDVDLGGPGVELHLT